MLFNFLLLSSLQFRIMLALASYLCCCYCILLHFGDNAGRLAACCSTEFSSIGTTEFSSIGTTVCCKKQEADVVCRQLVVCCLCSQS